MSNKFIQETVSREILVAQRDASVIRQFCATEYEGDIKGKGTSVKVNILIPATLKDTSTSPVSREADGLDTNTVTISLEQDKNYKFEISHKDVAEGMPTGMFAETLTDIGQQIALEADKLVLSKYTEVLKENIIPKASVDKSNIYDYLIDLDVKMDELEIPQMGRIVVLPPRIAGLLAKDTIIRTAKEQDMPLGYVTKVGNLTIVKSNNVAIKEVSSVKDSFECLAFVAGKTFAHVNGFCEDKVVDSSVVTTGFKDIAMGQIISGAKLVMAKYAVLFEISYK
ncbi:hypothetical protein [Clostridium tagluense]|uniref:Uncharacterized protein n=1 Tax=Clostridium tagluense TaxID=360422 RepID=A0A401ULQ8_9CLOT|nr:hypothetical protein [Clostridium tagluense]GCD10461.1 hypothetical protein Ctaglu_20840 [Clostridium tagluense]